MNELNLDMVQQVVILVLPLLLGVVVHEVAHGWMANRLGDATALMAGRLTLNPIKHIDPIGTLLIPLLLFVTGAPFIFGWAKPVPVICANLRRPKRDMAMVAAAGPLANLLMALAWGVLVKISHLILLEGGFFELARPLILLGLTGISINTVLMAFNLLPVPPLDGGRILIGVLPEPLTSWLTRFEPYGMILLLLLLSTGTWGQIMTPLVTMLHNVILSVLHI